MRRLMSLVVLASILTGCHKFNSDKMTAALEQTVSAKAVPRYAGPRWKAMQAIYLDRQYAPIWLSRDRPRQEARDLVDALTQADAQGLRMRDYDLPGLRNALDSAYHKGKTTEQELANLDLRLTSLFLDYGNDLLTGRLDPAAVDSGWYIRNRRSAVDSTLRAAIGQRGFSAMVAPLTPQLKEYGDLVHALDQYRQLGAKGGWATVPAGPALKPGAQGARVAALRARLAATGDLSGTGDAYDGSVAGGVRRFQARHGLDSTGTVDAATLAALNVPIAVRIRQLELNLERLRWLPNDFGQRYVLVNIPDYTLHAFDAGKEVLTMRVVVGSEYGHATPVFADTMNSVVFRPYWNVPRDIVNEEVVPKMRTDKHYLDEHHYEVVRGKGDEVVDPGSIDWGDLDTSKVDFRVRQKPGDDNSLGRVKFMFPNQFDIYMHDTPAHSLFGRNARALSHGCVRLEHPDRLADYVFEGDPAWPPEKIREAMEADSSRQVAVRRKLPVYIVYLTAFARDGQIQFRDDPYGADARAIARLGPPVADAALDSARAALRKLMKS